MQKNSLTIIAFILAFGAFISLRVYAGSDFSVPKTETIATSNNEDDSKDNTKLVNESVASNEVPTSNTITSKNADILVEGLDSTDTATLLPTTVPTKEPVPTTIPTKTPIPTPTPTEVPVDEDYNGVLNDTWHGDFDPKQKYDGKTKRILCWGDSLTETLDNRTAYPDVLRSLTDCEVINYGVSSETTNTIAMREGGLPITVSATVIPSSCEMIPVFLESNSNKKLFLLDYGDAGINPCSIAGIEGTLRKINGSYYFTRSKEGERTSIDSGAPLVTFAASDGKASDVLILFTGTNDKPDSESIYDIIDTQKQMIEASGTDKYIVVGLTYNEGIKDIDTVNTILANEYEDHFIDFRTYLLNYGLEDAKIKPTSTDVIDISKGNIPSSLMKDYVHGNKYYQKLLAEQILRRLQFLGYLPIQ